MTEINKSKTATPAHGVKVGDMFSMSWGYDQTNVNYFQVTRVTEKGVYIREIGAKSVPGTQGFMCESVTPNPGSFLERSQWCSPRTGYSSTSNVETFRKIQFSRFGLKEGQPSQPYFNFEGRYYARPVKAGESTYNSWYA